MTCFLLTTFESESRETAVDEKLILAGGRFRILLVLKLTRGKGKEVVSQRWD